MIWWNQKDKQAPKHNCGWTPWTSRFKSLFFPPQKSLDIWILGTKDQCHFIHALFSILPLSRQHMTQLYGNPAVLQALHPKPRKKPPMNSKRSRSEPSKPWSRAHGSSWGVWGQDKFVPKTTVDFWDFQPKTRWSNSLKSPFASTLEKVH